MPLGVDSKKLKTMIEASGTTRNRISHKVAGAISQPVEKPSSGRMILARTAASSGLGWSPINPATGRSVRLRNTSMETFQVTYNPFDGNADRSRQKSGAGCMQCHNVTGINGSYAWVDAAEEVVPISKQ